MVSKWYRKILESNIVAACPHSLRRASWINSMTIRPSHPNKHLPTSKRKSHWGNSWGASHRACFHSVPYSLTPREGAARAPSRHVTCCLKRFSLHRRANMQPDATWLIAPCNVIKNMRHEVHTKPPLQPHETIHASIIRDRSAPRWNPLTC